MSMLPSTISSASEIKTNYMLLLVAQLRNQDPLDPMSNDQMTSQLAQLSQLEHLESLDSTFKKALVATQVHQAMGMIGKNVTFMPEGQDNAVAGEVQNIGVMDGEVLVSVDVTDESGDTSRHVIDVEDILTITESDMKPMQSLDNTFQKSLFATQISEAMGMIGKKVAFIPPGQKDAVEGIVQNLSIKDGEVLLSVNAVNETTGETTAEIIEHVINLGKVQAVTESDQTLLQENMNNG